MSASGAIVGLSASQPGRLEYRARPADPPMLLTSDPSLVDRQPTFAPDGRSVLFVRAAKEAPGVSRGIWVVGVDGRELRQLSADGTDPRWLP